MLFTKVKLKDLDSILLRSEQITANSDRTIISANTQLGKNSQWQVARS